MVAKRFSFIVTILLCNQFHLILSECVNGELYPHETNCQLFYQCSNAQLYILVCPCGLLFNPVVSVCDFPENVDCEHINPPGTEPPEISTTTNTPRPPTTTTVRTTTIRTTTPATTRRTTTKKHSDEKHSNEKHSDEVYDYGF